MIRDELAWSEYWRWDVEDTIVAIYYDSDEKPSGYIVYLLENDVFKIKEMIYLSEEARRGIWEYVYAHKSMYDRVEGANFSNHSLAFLLEDGHIKESISPYIMGRIVDVEQFLSAYPFDKFIDGVRVAFVVDDLFLEWNDGVFLLEFDEKSAHIKKLGIDEYGKYQNLASGDEVPNAQVLGAPNAREAGADKATKARIYEVKLDIQTLSAMLLGYKRPLYLKRIGRLEADSQTLDLLEEILPEGKAYFSDYF